MSQSLLSSNVDQFISTYYLIVWYKQTLFLEYAQQYEYRTYPLYRFKL